MNLYELLCEELDQHMIISVDDCNEDSYEVDLPNGETVSCSDLAGELYPVFSNNGIRIMSNENPFSVLVNLDGKVVGGIVTSHDLEDDEDFDMNPYGTTNFSIVVDPSARKSPWAYKLIKHLIRNIPRGDIKGQVINPAIIPLLRMSGFEQLTQDGSPHGVIFVLDRTGTTKQSLQKADEDWRLDN